MQKVRVSICWRTVRSILRVQRAKQPRTKEIGLVARRAVPVSDFQVQRAKHPRTQKIAYVSLGLVGVSNLLSAKLQTFSVTTKLSALFFVSHCSLLFLIVERSDSFHVSLRLPLGACDAFTCSVYRFYKGIAD